MAHPLDSINIGSMKNQDKLDRNIKQKGISCTSFSGMTMLSLMVTIFFLMSTNASVLNLLKLSNNERMELTTENTKRVSLAEEYIKFEWDNENISNHSIKFYNKKLQTLVDLFATKILQEPAVNINESCKPIPLKTITTSDCLVYPDVFTGQVHNFSLQQQPIKVAHLIQLGFDADTLEILLHELNDVVDLFFIIESTKTHYKYIEKPLIWEHLKHTKRFQKYNEKVIHLILDDSKFSNFVPHNYDIDKWENENLQVKYRWLKFIEWNERNEYFSSNDIIGFGDTDEIPTRENINLLKQCVWKDINKSIDIKIWFPYGDLSKAYLPGSPKSIHPWTYPHPTYCILSNLYVDNYPNKFSRASKHFLLGGAHLTHYYFFPHYFIKLFTCTSCWKKLVQRYNNIASDSKNIIKNKSINKTITTTEIIIEIMNKQWNSPLIYWNISRPELNYPNPRIISYNATENKDKDDWDNIVKLPWFLECNRNRFPGWSHQIDERWQ